MPDASAWMCVLYASSVRPLYLTSVHFARKVFDVLCAWCDLLLLLALQSSLHDGN